MCNIEFTTELLFVWASDEQRIPTVRTGEVSAHRKQLLHCAEMMDGKEALSGAKHQLERDPSADTTFMLLGCVSVSLSSHLSSLLFAPRERNVGAKRTLLMRYKFPGIRHSSRSLPWWDSLGAIKESIVCRSSQVNLERCCLPNWKLENAKQLMAIGSCFLSWQSKKDFDVTENWKVLVT